MLEEILIQNVSTGVEVPREEEDGIWTFHKNWARLQHEESTCPNWQELSSSTESNEEGPEGSIRDNTLESQAQTDEGA